MPRKPQVNYCNCCGQLIPPRLIFENKPVRQRIFDYIAAHPEGVTRHQIVAHVYADDADGGPESISVIGVHIHRMKPALKPYGITIQAAYGQGAKYKLIPYQEAAE